MNAQYTNLALSSFVLWLDNRILTLGNGYRNVTGVNFYPISQTISNIYTYSNPYGQIVGDQSVPGASIMNGIWSNNIYYSPNSSLVDINYDKGQIYTSSKLSNITGTCAIKEYSITTPSYSQLRVLFEEKIDPRPKTYKYRLGDETGLLNNQLSYPMISVMRDTQTNPPFAIGGFKQTQTRINCFVFSDSPYSADALVSLMTDSNYRYIPLLDASEMPWNVYGGYKNGLIYNYTGITAGKVADGQGMLIKDVRVTNFPRNMFTAVSNLPPNVYFTALDFLLWRERLTQ